MDVSKYSVELENKLWDAVGADYEFDYNYEDLLQQLNSKDFFRPFSLRLLNFYNKVTNNEFGPNEAANDLLRRAAQKEIHMTRNTVKDWFAGKREPKKGVEDRRRMFCIAFALELSIAETEELFHKVFLDKAFNRRNPNEFIFLHCLKSKKTFSAAEYLISQIDSEEGITDCDATMLTSHLDEAAQADKSNEDVVEFILTHPHNFALNNTAAKARLEKLLADIQGTKKCDGLALREFKWVNSDLKPEGRETNSVDFMLYVIKNQDWVKDNEYVERIRAYFPHEIINQFPDKQSLSLCDPSSYVLRKELIFLYFYWYWVKERLEQPGQGDLDGFCDEMNDVLFECGYSPLYIGNPYDWLFMYCSAGSEPLDVFRGMLAANIDPTA